MISGQAMDTLGALLHLLADPKAYEQQLNTLRKAIDENRKYVELIAPAGEIMNMLEAQRVAGAEADKRLADAKTQARKMIDDAQIMGDDFRAKAAEDAKTIKAAAASELEKVKADADEVRNGKKVLAEAKKATDEAEKATAATEVERQALMADRAALAQAQAAADAIRAELAAKLDKIREL